MTSSNAKKGILDEAPGRRSAMRVMSMIALISAIVLAFLVVTAESTATQDVYIVFGFLLAAFAPKALQKFAEPGNLPQQP